MVRVTFIAAFNDQASFPSGMVAVFASGCRELQQVFVEDASMLFLARDAVLHALMAEKGLSQATVDRYRHAYGPWPCQRAFCSVGGQFEKAIDKCVLGQDGIGMS